MDWDNLSAVDLLSLFSSFCKGDMMITKVEIYPSLFGLEQMKKDALYGPPKEMFDVKNKKEKDLKKIEEKQEFQSDSDIDGEFDQ